MAESVTWDSVKIDGDYRYLVVHLQASALGAIATTNLPEINGKLLQAATIPKNAALANAWNLDVYTPYYDATFATGRTNVVDGNAISDTAVVYHTVVTTTGIDLIHGPLAVKCDSMGDTGKADLILIFEIG